MRLPSPIQTYFAADERGDGEAVAGTFAPDAVVSDEGHSYTGRPAIDAWRRETKARYQVVAEPLEADGDCGVTTIRARVTGQFPGSPAMINFTFRLSGDLIARLEITA